MHHEDISIPELYTVASINQLFSHKQIELINSAEKLRIHLQEEITAIITKLAKRRLFVPRQMQQTLQILADYLEKIALPLTAGNLQFFIDTTKVIYTSKLLSSIKKQLNNYQRQFINLESQYFEFQDNKSRVAKCLERIYRSEIAIEKEKIINDSYESHKISRDAIKGFYDCHPYFLLQLEEDRKYLKNLLKEMSNPDIAEAIVSSLALETIDKLDDIQLKNQFRLILQPDLEHYVSEATHRDKISFLDKKLQYLSLYYLQVEIEHIQKIYKKLGQEEEIILLRHALLRNFIGDMEIEAKIFFWDFILKITFADSASKLSVDLQKNQLSWCKKAHDQRNNDDLHLLALSAELKSILLEEELAAQNLETEFARAINLYQKKLENHYRNSFYEKEIVDNWIEKVEVLKAIFLQQLQDVDKVMINQRQTGIEMSDETHHQMLNAYLAYIKSVAAKANDAGVQVSAHLQIHTAEDNKSNTTSTQSSLAKSIVKGIGLGILSLVLLGTIGSILYLTGGAGAVLMGALLAFSLKSLGLVGSSTVVATFTLGFATCTQIVADKIRDSKKVIIHQEKRQHNHVPFTIVEEGICKERVQQKKQEPRNVDFRNNTYSPTLFARTSSLPERVKSQSTLSYTRRMD